MSTIVNLPNGESAVLKDTDDLTNREIKTLRKSARSASAIALDLERAGYSDDNPESWKIIAEMPEADYDNIDLFQRTCVIIRLKSWTLDRPLPADADEVDDLPQSIYAPLVTAAADLSLDDEFTMEGASDPLAPTADSDDSRLL